VAEHVEPYRIGVAEVVLQAVHVVAEPTQLLQLGSHGAQVDPLTKVPAAGQDV